MTSYDALQFFMAFCTVSWIIQKIESCIAQAARGPDETE